MMAMQPTDTPTAMPTLREVRFPFPSESEVNAVALIVAVVEEAVEVDGVAVLVGGGVFGGGV
jgi:hypothetical protein